MKRTILVAAVASAPLLALAGHASAQLSISTSTSTPVATATAVSNAPANIDITSAGSIGVTASGAAVTLNSSNTVSNEGAIGFTDIDNATGILVKGGNTGSVTNTGTITVTESYSPGYDPNNDGLIAGNFASGGNRWGIEVAGPGTFTGGITNEGTITVHGNGSYGVDIETPITGSYTSYTLTTPATATTDGVTSVGLIGVVGNNSVGFMVSPTGGVGGSIQLTGINVSGVGSGTRGAVIDGPVGSVTGGGIEVAGTVTATGFRTTTRAVNPAVATLYTAPELGIGGSALTVGGSVAGGLLISAPPLILSTTNLAQDNDNNGIPDNLQGTGQVTSYGSAPALQIGDHGLSANLGLVVSPTPANPIPGTVGYGLVVQGTVFGDGLFDQITSPNLLNPISATAIQLGTVDPTSGKPDSSVFIAGGIHNTGGISAQAYQADSTAIHILSGVTTPTIVNDGSIVANTQEVSTATTGTPALNVNAILIEKGATIGSIVNSGAIVGNLTGTGGVGGAVGAIIDRSGSVASITNTGIINAALTQTLITAPMPGTQTAIDLRAGTGPQFLTQSANTAFTTTPAFNNTVAYTAGQLVVENNVVYEALTASAIGVDAATNPSIWREVGAQTPSIDGSIYFGSGGTTLTVSAGTVLGQTIDLGAGVNTVNISGAGTVVAGSLLDEGKGTLTLNVASGVLSSTNSALIQANSINVGATGVLLAEGNPLTPKTPQFTVSGASTFQQGAQVGINLSGIQAAGTQTYIVIQAVGAGTISAGTFSNAGVTDAPFLYNEQTQYQTTTDGHGEITVTAGLKSQSQLGFTNAEAAALPAILADAPTVPGLQSALLSQTTQAGLKSVYDQLLPSQGQGLFDALDKAAQSVSELTSTTPDAGTRVEGSSLWLQEVNERVHRTGLETQGSYSKVLGVIGGYERMGPAGGAVGLTLAYYNAEESEDAQQIGGDTVASMVEAGAYYRRAIGGLTFAVRGAGGYAWFSSERRLVATGVTEQANSNWGGYFMDGHVSVSYEQRLGRFYARPEASADYLRLHESAHGETGGDPGFDLNIADRTSSRLSGEAVLAVGTQWGKSQWLRTEVRGGYREVFSGDVGDTTANFAGGSAFTLAPDADTGGWATFGFSIKGGSQYSYLALEGDADFRSGEQRYDVRLAGRSIF